MCCLALTLSEKFIPSRISINFLFSVFQYGISRLTGYLRRRTVTVTDERVRMMNELLSCVKLIKMYAWEKSFATTIAGIVT